MGRSGWKTTAESARRIELSWLKNQGYFDKDLSFKSGNIQWSIDGEPTSNIGIQVDTSAGMPHIRLIYRTRNWWEKSEDAWEDRDYRFPLEKIHCRYGRYKWFVRCQLSKGGMFCGRRVRVLYSVGGYYGCRRCADITYQSCNYGGRYKGFMSIPDLDKFEERVRRQYYAGKPTRKYRRFLEMEQKFNHSFAKSLIWLKSKVKK